MNQEVMNRSQKLRVCDICKMNAEPTGGIDVRVKWYCAKCWMKFIKMGKK